MADGLPEPRTEAGREGLAALIATPGRALIALDFDGTLAPIVPDPAQARALPAAVTALRELAGLAGTVAIVTGRPAVTAVEYGSFDQVPGIIVLGLYGRQRWQDGTLSSPPPPPGLAAARAQLDEVLAGADAPAGTWIEDKGDAVTVHTRRAADASRAIDRLRGPLAELASRTGLISEPGRLAIELRPPGADKGLAIKYLSAEKLPAATLFCGDDVGDRPAYRAVRELRRTGIPGLTVCSGSAEVPELAAEADLVVDGPPGVAALLAGLAAAFSKN